MSLYGYTTYQLTAPQRFTPSQVNYSSEYLLDVLSILLPHLQSAATMGTDAGFDISPPLSKGFVDRQNWSKFIDFIKELYRGDSKVEIKPNYINFNAGEHPKLPLEGYKCLRFSSKVSGSTAAASGVERYINTVTKIAQVHFGSRIQYWNEGADQYGIYDWNTVHRSIESYEQVRHFLPLSSLVQIKHVLIPSVARSDRDANEHR